MFWRGERTSCQGVEKSPLELSPVMVSPMEDCSSPVVLATPVKCWTSCPCDTRISCRHNRKWEELLLRWKEIPSRVVTGEVVPCGRFLINSCFGDTSKMLDLLSWWHQDILRTWQSARKSSQGEKKSLLGFHWLYWSPVEDSASHLVLVSTVKCLISCPINTRMFWWHNRKWEKILPSWEVPTTRKISNHLCVGWQL